MSETPRPRSGPRPGRRGVRARRRASIPTGRVPDCFEHTDGALFGQMVDPELDGIHAGQSRSLTDGEFPRIVLLELPWRSHAVVAQADGNGRSFLSYLECTVPVLNDVRYRLIDPRILNAIHDGSH